MPFSNQNSTRAAPPRPAPVQPGAVLVVGRSPVNLIVVSRIAERARMKVATALPDEAGDAMAELQPMVVILDAGAELSDCDQAMEPIRAARRANGGVRPYVVMLTPTNVPIASVTGGDVDATVSKPITADRLQPLLESIRDGAPL
jgi:CheY-like chemotaxis protein